MVVINDKSVSAISTTYPQLFFEMRHLPNSIPAEMELQRLEPQTQEGKGYRKE